MAVVEFEPAAFREAYPRFTAELISDAQLQQAFDLACLLLDNTDASLSGPLSSATEGSVSVSFSIPQNIGKAFYSQTPCGQAFWQAVQPYAAGGRYYAVRHWHPWG